MTDNMPVANDTSPYEAFLEQLTDEPMGAELEGWARTHPDDPDADRALMDAAHQHAFDDEHPRALDLFTEVRRRGGTEARNALCGIVDELLALGRAAEADEQLAVLRSELEADPEPDLGMYADVAGVLDDRQRPDDAIAWCEAGIARTSAQAEATDGENESFLADARARMLMLRHEIRGEKGLEPDALDKEAEEEDERSRESVQKVLENLARLTQGQNRRSLLPDDGAAYNAVILHWPEPEFAAVRERWPDTEDLYGTDYAAYCRLLEREAQGYSDAGAARTVITHGALDSYEAYADRTGTDPSQRQSRRDYGEWSATARPERTQAWPPPRNGPCWCGSARKYKKCCGSPSNA